MSKKFHIATDEEIRGGKVTDVYFSRTLEILKTKNIDKHVVMEIRTRSLPLNWNRGVLAGVEEVVHLLEGKKITLEIIPEGTFFHAGEPVAEISGMYQEICIYETAILGLLCQASGIATNTSRCKFFAGDRTVLSFGARRMHPAIAPMIERSAYIGGADGVSTLAGAELIGVEPSGTIPHALILILGDTVSAMEAFHEVIDKKIKRVALIDTLQDEKFEALRVAEKLGKNLFAIRFDTPSSRRGNFVDLIKEVRWELNLRGFEHVKIFVSGGIDEKKIIELNEVVDGYGIGTHLSNSPTIDFAMDIVEIDGEPFAKRGKESGKKLLLRCKKCWTTYIKSAKFKYSKCECGGNLENLMQKYIDNGKLVKKLPSALSIREYVLKQLERIKKEEKK